MSDNWITIIPASADYIPSREARQKALSLFRSIAPHADDIREESSEIVRFIDCGGNFERVKCPNCDTDANLTWWQERMDHEEKLGYPLQNLAMPCCGARKTLNQLNYDWPQGFARCSVAALNPDIPDLTNEQMKAFESVLGCRVRKVLQHL